MNHADEWDEVLFRDLLLLDRLKAEWFHLGPTEMQLQTHAVKIHSAESVTYSVAITSRCHRVYHGVLCTVGLTLSNC